METDSEPPIHPEPIAPAIWGPIATMLWGVLVALVFVFAQVVTLGVYIAVTVGPSARGKMNEMVQGLASDGTFLALCTFVTLCVCTPLVIGIAKLKRRSVLKEYLGFKAPGMRQLLFWSAFTLCFCLLTDLMLALLQQQVVPPFMMDAYRWASPRWMIWLAVGVGAPVLEEVFFRGFLFTGLAASRLRSSGAIIVTSTLWAAIHQQYDWVGILVIFCLGLLLGTVRARTGSTLLTIWLHCLVNLIATAEVAIALSST